MHREHHADAFEAARRGRLARPRAQPHRDGTDNRYSATPTLAGDKGLNGRQMHGLRRRNAPTSVDLERNDAPYVRPYVRLFVLRDEGAVRNSTNARARAKRVRAFPLFQPRRVPVPFSSLKPASIALIYSQLVHVRTLEVT